MSVRIALVPVLVALACLMAGLYGAVHNQISYSVGPDYFHHLKFAQFGIEDYLRGRFGAAIVGWFASWWMGLVIGLPVALLSLAMPSARAMVAGFVQTAILIMAVTLALGSLSLIITLPADQHELFRIPASVADPAGFMQAALMHEMSYAGGLVGLIIGLIWLWLRIRRARRAVKT